MTNHTLQNSSGAKCDRILAAVGQEIVISDDDNSVAEGMDICNVMENSTDETRHTDKSYNLQSLGETIRKTLLEINEIREQNRERRHRELLQILSKMVQQENTPKDEGNDPITNLNREVLNHDQENTTCEYDVEEDTMKKYFSNADEVAGSGNSSTTYRNKSDQSDIDSTSTFTSSSSANLKLLRKSNRNNEDTGTTKNIAVNHDDTKSEFQKMRVKMMELQRQKMEDRERKKLKFTQTENI